MIWVMQVLQKDVSDLVRTILYDEQVPPTYHPPNSSPSFSGQRPSRGQPAMPASPACLPAGACSLPPQGQATVKVELLHDLEYILSAFIRRVQFIPVPRVAVTTPDMDFVADGIVINLRELTPKQIHLETLTKVHDKDLEQGKKRQQQQEEARAISRWVARLGGGQGRRRRRRTEQQLLWCCGDGWCGWVGGWLQASP